jgi:hypothetical protein
MATETEQLVVALEARIRDFERNFQKAGKTANDSFGKIEKRAKLSGDRLESTMSAATARIGGVFKSFGAGLLGGIAAGGIAGIVGQIGQVAAGVAEIGDQAKRAGVTTEVFQEWAIVAQQARIPIDTLTDGLKELQLRGDEFAVTGKGSAAEAFGRLGYGATELKAKLADPSALLLEIIERLGRFDKAAQIRISDELFGGSAGERFVELLDRGADSIRGTIDQAHRLGNVLSDDVITRAAEVDRQFKIISQTVGTALKGAIVDAVNALIVFIDKFRDFENQQDATLSSQVTEIGAKRLDLENQILAVKQEQRELDGGLTDNARDLGFGSGSAVEQDRVTSLETEQAALAATEAQILAVIEARRKAREIAPTNSAPFTPPAYTPPAVAGGGTPKRDASAASAEREANAVRTLIAELERELTLIGATDLEREISNALRDAGAAATDDQRAKIAALITALHAEEAAQEKATDAKQEFASIAGGAITGFVSDLRNGATAGEAFGNMINGIADKLIDMAVQMAIIKPLMSIFGLSGGGIVPGAGKVLALASGGRVSGPGTGKSDSIPARLSDGEFVVNAASTRKHRALLEAINSGTITSFANGGMAGKPLASRIVGGGSHSYVGGDINISVAGGSQGPEADKAMAGNVAKEARAAVRAEIAAFTAEQTRNGGMLRTGKFT